MSFVSGIQQLQTVQGTLLFNAAAAPRLLVVGLTGMGTATLRAAVDELPQLDGAIVHRALYGARYPGIRVLLQGTDANSVAAYEQQIKGYVGSIRAADGRLIFTPPGQAQQFLTVRMGDAIDDFEPLSTGNFGEPLGFLKVGTLPLVAGDPYAYTYTQDVNDIVDGGSLAISNLGDAPSFPVLRVYGPYTSFAIANTTTGQTISMGATNPMSIASGHYIEIINRLETCVRDGNAQHVEGYVDVAASGTFWSLQPGSNTITASFTGGSGTTKVTVLSNSAWN